LDAEHAKCLRGRASHSVDMVCVTLAKWWGERERERERKKVYLSCARAGVLRASPLRAASLRTAGCWLVLGP
jgi:hypothetical protein